MQSTEPEIWKPVLGYEGHYEVSSEGRIRSLDRLSLNGKRLRGRYLTITAHHRTGHLYVTLTARGCPRKIAVHRIVLEAFVGPAPKATEACHWDGNPTNNTVPNLRWDSHAANMQDMIRHGKSGRTAWEKCSRGHLLSGANVASNGHGRRCRTCHRTRKACAARGIPFDSAIADEHYQQIMSN